MWAIFKIMFPKINSLVFEFLFPEEADEVLEVINIIYVINVDEEEFSIKTLTD